MSHQLINLNPDLKQLRDEGFCIGIVASHLVVKNVPYVNSAREIKYGVLISQLDMAGERTAKPKTHVAMFSGEHPCEADGTTLSKIAHNSEQKSLGEGLTANHSFSSKPADGYSDYYHKMSTYCAIISAPARQIDPSVTAQQYLPVKTSDAESVFHYLDTASSRAGIGAVSEKLKVPKVGIIGLGGTGSYVLDLIAKTPVAEIHLFDSDVFLSHNAFRAPGAATIDDLNGRPAKVAYLADVYGRFRRGIIPHKCHIDASNLELLVGMHSVFLCMDGSEAKKVIIDFLESQGIPFIDVGMGINLVDDKLSGILRTTTSTPTKREHVHEKNLIPCSGQGDNPYDTNIQVADLNALNACLAVIKWKKLLGFYCDLDKEHHSLYTIDGNHLTNTESA
jgi:tRNA A37 threonylcarbamoyladenosine dehydratase